MELRGGCLRCLIDVEKLGPKRERRTREADRQNKRRFADLEDGLLIHSPVVRSIKVRRTGLQFVAAAKSFRWGSLEVPEIQRLLIGSFLALLPRFEGY